MLNQSIENPCVIVLHFYLLPHLVMARLEKKNIDIDYMGWSNFDDRRIDFFDFFYYFFFLMQQLRDWGLNVQPRKRGSMVH